MIKPQLVNDSPEHHAPRPNGDKEQPGPPLVSKKRIYIDDSQADIQGSPVDEHGQEDRFNQRMGAKIRAARKEARLVQAQLAQMVGLSRASITNIEAGSQAPPPYRLALIADVLKVSLADLLPELAELGGVEAGMPKHLAEALASVTSAASEVEGDHHGKS
jgi:transcriptional regulator with XRE-family HTH domain